ncbi:MAG: response regulator [Thermodesulfobacteriota bacterium]
MATGKQKIMVLDDEEIIRDVAGEVLSAEGYEVVFAESGEEAVELYRTEYRAEVPIALVLIDLTLPGISGEDTFKKLKEIDPEVKAIVSSGYTTDPVMLDFRSYGFAGAVAKPYPIKALRELVANILSS